MSASELSEQFTHASGPGGQGVNTADSRVQLSLDLAATTRGAQDPAAQTARRVELGQQTAHQFRTDSPALIVGVDLEPGDEGV